MRHCNLLLIGSLSAAPRRAAAMLCVLALAWLGTARAASLTATLDRNVVPVGESVTLSLIFEDAGNVAAPPLPPVPNLTPLPGVSQRSEFNFVNGQQTVRIIHDFRFAANQPGDIVIPAIQAQAGGQALQSRPLQLKILPASAAAQAAQAAQQAALSNLAFIRLIVPRTEFYLGEAIPVEMHLYWLNAQEVNVPQLRADGFSLGQMPKPAQTRTQVGNAIYNLVICKLTATAARTGTLTLGPATTSLTALIPANDRRPRGFFDFGPAHAAHPMNIASEAIAVRVLPLPRENVPPGFSGAIGNYRMNFSAGPTNLTVGDPITIKVQISGNGPIESLTLPAQTDWRDFTTYPPTAKTDVADPLGLSGTKHFEQVVVPQNHEVRALPPLRFSFFDPLARAYRTLTSPAQSLTIRPTATASAPLPTLTNASGTATPPPADDIVHIRPRLDTGRPAMALLAAQPWFLGLQSVPVVLWLALLIRRNRAESLANNPRLRRQREVAARVRDGLKELRAQAGARQSDEFFATLFRILQEQLGERLDLPASAITEAVIDERLRGRGLSDEALRALRELFHACNAARYAPVQSAQELAALVPKTEEALRAVQQLKA